MACQSQSRGLAVGLVLAVLAGALCLSQVSAEEQSDQVVAGRLAEFLRSARTVISQYQELINDPAKGDKGLTGERVLAEATVIYQKQTGEDPAAVDPASKEGRLLRAQMDAIKDVMAENQSAINAPDVGFKGFIPAIFARLVNEKFQEKAGGQAADQGDRPGRPRPQPQGAPRRLGEGGADGQVRQARLAEGAGVQRDCRRRRAAGVPPDRAGILQGRPASPAMAQPKGEMDITGYPKEGGKEGDLGAAISVTLFQ